MCKINLVILQKLVERNQAAKICQRCYKDYKTFKNIQQNLKKVKSEVLMVYEAKINVKN